MAERIRNLDWAATPLGSIAGWPSSLKAAVAIGLDSAFPTFIWWGPELIQLYNDSAIAIHRAKHPAALGRQATKVWAEVWPDVGPLFARVLATGAPFRTEDLPLLPDRGGPREAAYFTFCYSALRDETGSIAGMQAVAIETTGRIRAEATLRDGETRQAFLLKLSDALRPLDDAIVIQATASRLLGAQLGVERAAYGELEADDASIVVARDWCRPGIPSIVGRFRIDDYGTFFTSPLRSGHVATIEDAATDPRIDPNLYASTWAAIGVRSAIACPILKQGRFVSAFFIHHDRPRHWREAEISLVTEVAERTWAASERARAEAAQREAEATRETFVEAAAHDLRSPLTSVKAQAQLLRRRAQRGQILDPDALVTGLTEIVNATDRMVAVIGEMLDATHLRSDRTLALIPAPTDLVALTRTAAEQTRRSNPGRTVRVEADLSNLIGNWDGARLRRVLDNLLGNAAKYSPGGGDITVHLNREEDHDGGAWAVLAVRDHGIGIPAADLPFLFRRYRRGSNVGGSIAGTGIGLAGAKQIIEQHGGTIEVESTEGEGSTFTVRLPLIPVPAAEMTGDR